MLRVFGRLEWGLDEDCDLCAGQWESCTCFTWKLQLACDAYPYREDQGIGGARQAQGMVSCCFCLHSISGDSYQGVVSVGEVGDVIPVTVFRGWHEQTLAFAQVVGIDCPEEGNVAFSELQNGAWLTKLVCAC